MDGSQSEWLLYTIQYLLQLDDRILTDCWDSLNFEQQIFLLEVLSSIPTANSSKFQILHIYCRMTSQFFDPLNFSTTDNSRSQFFALFDIVTKFLCDFYSVEDADSRNLRNMSIAENIFGKTVKLLSEIQKLCREQHPLFKIDKNISEISGNLSAKRLFHGLKQNLVNLIANISYKCPKIQHKGFELEAIYLILDCTKLDPNNPFLTQWAILAIRNLLENCAENQTLVNQMKANSIADGLDEEFFQKLNVAPMLNPNGKVVFAKK
uniref:Ataxin-10 domain-containing protein n=1 Tax=Romanomermis culicivorax TaxID=13658 RepID=A0A915J7H2_ROMCU